MLTCFCGNYSSVFRFAHSCFLLMCSSYQCLSLQLVMLFPSIYLEISSFCLCLKANFTGYTLLVDRSFVLSTYIFYLCLLQVSISMRNLPYLYHEIPIYNILFCFLATFKGLSSSLIFNSLTA